MKAEKERALSIIEALESSCRSDESIYKGDGYQRNIRQLCYCVEFFKREILNESSPANPSYHHYGSAISKLIIIFNDYTTVFNNMFANIFGSDCNLNTLSGITNVVNFLTAIYDDHSYQVDTSSGLPVFFLSDNKNLKMVSPKTLMSELSKIC